MLKYPSILNNHHFQSIGTQIIWTKIYPTFNNLRYILQEKYDGCNISFEFNKNEKSFKLFTRNQQLGGNADFHGIRQFLTRPEYDEFILKIQKWQSESNVRKINLFGEYVGPKIQKRITYGSDNNLLFFDVYFDEVLLSASDFMRWMIKLDSLDKAVSFFNLENSLDKAIEIASYNCEQVTCNV